MKFCKRCKENLKETKFFFNHLSIDKLSLYCKSCAREKRYKKLRRIKIKKQKLALKARCKYTIYSIICLVNDKLYIGCTKDLTSRIEAHFSSLKRSKHPNYLLQEDYNKYNRNNFNIKILKDNVLKSKRIKEEFYFISKNIEKCYNITSLESLSYNYIFSDMGGESLNK